MSAQIYLNKFGEQHQIGLCTEMKVKIIKQSYHWRMWFEIFCSIFGIHQWEALCPHAKWQNCDSMFRKEMHMRGCWRKFLSMRSPTVPYVLPRFPLPPFFWFGPILIFSSSFPSKNNQKNVEIAKIHFIIFELTTFMRDLFIDLGEVEHNITKSF